MKIPIKTWAALSTAAITSFAAIAQQPESAANDGDLLQDAREVLGALAPSPNGSELTPAAELGRALFWDPRISADGATSCASCHLAQDGGADQRRFSLDARGKLTQRNSQTVFNAMQQPALRWTGDRKSGAHQAERSLTGSMGFASAGDAVPRLRQSGYEPAFRKAWPSETDPVTPANYASALQTYQATLVTPSDFDRYLAGDTRALNPQQKDGLRIFLNRGCADCHGGPLLGGTKIRKFGLEKPYWTATRSENRDAGLYETSRKEEDRYRFRVSMLRNIARTAPYFHDGSVSDLKEAVRVMAEVQLGDLLTDPEAEALVAFLQSLTGEVPAHYAPPAAAVGGLK